MKSKRVFICMLICALAFSSTACFITDLVSNLTGGANDTSQADVSRSEAGGFEFIAPADYQNIDTFGIVQLIAPDGTEDSGPAFLLMGGMNSTEMTNEELQANLLSNETAVDFSNPKPITVDGIEGFTITVNDFGGAVPLEGRLVALMVTSSQSFTMLGMAPKGEWKSVNKDFEKVLKSIHFFDPIVEDYSMDVLEPTVQWTEVPAITAETTQEPVIPNPDGSLSQWAVYAQASTQYSEDYWSALQAVGEPNVEACGDDTLAWASETAVGEDWLEVTFATPVVPSQLTIVQTFNPSQVVSLVGIAEDGTEYDIWSGQAEVVNECPYWMVIDIQNQGLIYINRVRITIDHSALNLGWNEIDAVQLVGTP